MLLQNRFVIPGERERSSCEGRGPRFGSRDAISHVCSDLVGVALDARAQSAKQLSSALECQIGPATKTYGGTKWLAYSCDDDRSVVVVSAPDSPAAPFYFLLSPGNNGYQLHGEGTGDKKATDAAYKELSILSERDIANLIAETKKH